MTTEVINSALIGIIREKIPPRTNLAHLLMDQLCIGKEAVYRRLRGEVPFTLAEAATLSSKLGISLDKLVGSSVTGNAIFDLHVMNNGNPLEILIPTLQNTLEVFRRLNQTAESEYVMAANVIPVSNMATNVTLSKFNIVKWLYQKRNLDNIIPFKDIEMPGNYKSALEEYTKEIQQFGSSTYIWDAMSFNMLVNDINYFRRIGVVDDQDAAIMKEEIMSLIDITSSIAYQGKFPSGKPVEIYISNINFDASYGYIKAKDYTMAMLQIFSINDLTSKDSQVYNYFREWIRSLKKFSFLISQSGEMQRIRFFNEQRKLVTESL